MFYSCTLSLPKTTGKKSSKHERFSEVLGKEIESCSTDAAFSLASYRTEERQQLETNCNPTINARLGIFSTEMQGAYIFFNTCFFQIYQLGGLA